MLEWILQYWVGIAFGAMAGVLASLMKQFKAYKDGTKTLLRNTILGYYNSYFPKGYVPIYVLENATTAYNSYKQLVDDSAIEKLYKDLIDLPTRKQD